MYNVIIESIIFIRVHRKGYHALVVRIIDIIHLDLFLSVCQYSKHENRIMSKEK